MTKIVRRTEQFDLEMYKVHIADGVSKARAKIFQAGLKHVDSYTDPKNRQEVYSVPDESI